MKLKKQTNPRCEHVETRAAAITDEHPPIPYNINDYLQPDDWDALVRLKDHLYDLNISYGTELFIISDEVSSDANRFLLFPDRQNEIIIDNQYFQNCLCSLQFLRHGDNFYNFFKLASSLTILCPSRKNELGLNEDDFEAGKKIISPEDPRDPWIKAEIARYLCVLFPNRKHELGLNQNYFLQMREKMHSLRDENFHNFTTIATSICAIFPEYKKDAEITDEDIKKMTNKLKQQRDANMDWDTFTIYALGILFTTSDEVRLTTQGYDFITHPSLSPTSKLPDRNLAS